MRAAIRHDDMQHMFNDGVFFVLFFFFLTMVSIQGSGGGQRVQEFDRLTGERRQDADGALAGAPLFCAPVSDRFLTTQNLPKNHYF